MLRKHDGWFSGTQDLHTGDSWSLPAERLTVTTVASPQLQPCVDSCYRGDHGPIHTCHWYTPTGCTRDKRPTVHGC